MYVMVLLSLDACNTECRVVCGGCNILGVLRTDCGRCRCTIENAAADGIAKARRINLAFGLRKSWGEDDFIR